MNYVIAVLPDRPQAEAAYAELVKEGLPRDQMSVLGKGYTHAEEFSFLDPDQQGRKQATLMSFWLVPFGLIAGYAFNLSTQFQLVPSAGTLGNRLIGALLGGVAAAMGSFFVGGGFFSGSSEELPYAKRLKEGKYLVAVKGAPNLTNQATRILRQFNPESLKSFVESGKVDR